MTVCTTGVGVGAVDEFLSTLIVLVTTSPHITNETRSIARRDLNENDLLWIHLLSKLMGLLDAKDVDTLLTVTELS